jgi:hypothetical protein
VGEIGIPRLEYLYELAMKDIILIERGYNARNRHLWSATRWQTYYTMMSTIGSDGMRKAVITAPKDLMEFPWEKDTPPPISEEDVAMLQQEMAALNS